MVLGMAAPFPTRRILRTPLLLHTDSLCPVEQKPQHSAKKFVERGSDTETLDDMRPLIDAAYAKATAYFEKLHS